MGKIGEKSRPEAWGGYDGETVQTPKARSTRDNPPRLNRTCPEKGSFPVIMTPNKLNE